METNVEAAERMLSTVAGSDIYVSAEVVVAAAQARATLALVDMVEHLANIVDEQGLLSRQHKAYLVKGRAGVPQQCDGLGCTCCGVLHDLYGSTAGATPDGERANGRAVLTVVDMVEHLANASSEPFPETAGATPDGERP